MMHSESSNRTQNRPMRGPFGGPPPGMGGAVEKARDLKGTFSKLLKQLKPYRVSIIIVLVFAMASTIFSIIGPKILGKATTKLFEGIVNQLQGSGTGIDFTYIGNILLLMLGLFVISSIFSYIQGWIMTGVSMKLTYNFRKDISEKINRMPLRYFDGTAYDRTSHYI